MYNFECGDQASSMTDFVSECPFGRTALLSHITEGLAHPKPSDQEGTYDTRQAHLLTTNGNFVTGCCKR